MPGPLGMAAVVKLEMGGMVVGVMRRRAGVADSEKVRRWGEGLGRRVRGGDGPRD